MLGREVELPLDLMIEAVPQDGESETAKLRLCDRECTRPGIGPE